VRLPSLDRYEALHQDKAANRNPDEHQKQEQAEKYSDTCTLLSTRFALSGFALSWSAFQHFSFMLMALAFGLVRALLSWVIFLSFLILTVWR
jgi:hypothetical protein